MADQPQNESSGNLHEIFDLDRKQLTRKLVDQMEQAMRDAESAREDLRQIVAAAKEAQFARQDVAAMTRIARLRLKDQRNTASEQLEALERVGQAVGFDLFDWGDMRGKDRPEAA